MGKIITASVLLTLACYASVGECASRPRKVSYKKAATFENSLLAREPLSQTLRERLFVQPVNKSEACKLPTSQDQLDRSNFSAYWDGECKNGFAFGLGRDIAMSDTHHVEEITIHDGTGDNWSKPHVIYNYVNNEVSYVMGGAKFPAQTAIVEKIDNNFSNFNVYKTIRVVDESGRDLAVQTSAFHPTLFLLNTRTDGSITYKFMDNSAAPVTNETAPVFSIEILDPRTNTRGGVLIVRYANGSVRHFDISDGKTETVSLAPEYVEHLIAKHQEISNATAGANATLQRAQQIEREYLYKACNGKSSIEGLDNAVYTKICNWRDQFKEPYANASATYQKQLLDLKEQATSFTQQQQIDQQIALQQKMLQQQQSQQIWNQLSQINQQTQQTMQGATTWQAPQVHPLPSRTESNIICNTVGNITTCK